jgi:hypothetical protein
MTIQAPVTLTTSSGSSRVDDLLRGLIGIFEMVFRRRIRAYYADIQRFCAWRA